MSLLALFVATACSGAPSPRVGDRWHASYAINICGHEEEPLPEFEGGVRTHGDGVIHIEPTVPSEEGEGARLVEFFRNAGGALTQRSIELPDGRVWRTGNICPDSRPGKVILVVNQGPLGKDLDAYVPRDGDRILVAFVPAGSAAPAPPPPPLPAND